MRDIFPEVVLPISDEPARDVCVAVGPGVDEVSWLTAPKSSLRNGAFEEPTDMQLHSYRMGPEVTRRTYTAQRRPHYVQPTRHGVLFASARTSGDNANAWWTDGALRNEKPLSLGDGLADVRLTSGGDIWAAYFDEGVFGGGAGGAGLIRFDRSGAQTWAYDAEKAGTEDIAEVYAFNLSADDEAWVYFYTPFEIVRWLGGEPTVWRTRVHGARALAQRADEALLFGDYDDRTSMRVLDLPRGGGKARVKRKHRLQLPDPDERQPLQAYGAADRLILWSNTSVMIVRDW